MRILMTGCDEGTVGDYLRRQLIGQGHTVCGVGLKGPDIEMDFNCLTAEPFGVGNLWDQVEIRLDGKVDVLINHAGYSHADWLEDFNVSEISKILNVNLMTPMLFCREFLQRIPLIEYSGIGTDICKRILCTTSMGVRTGMRTFTPYIVSKAGLEAMVRNLSREVAGRYAVSVFGIAPCAIAESGMMSQAVDGVMRTRRMEREEAGAYVNKSTGTMISQEDLWKIYDFAVNNAPSILSGSILTVSNGGGVS